ncbi:MAG TPA: polysaccharide biosynthesis/export family protein [Hyphomicrobiales bacterium]
MPKMILVNRSLIAFIIATMVSAGAVRDVCSAETETAGERIQPDDGAMPAQPKSLLGIGDRLKIAFFELIDVSNAGNQRRWDASVAAALQTSYQRMDLTGDYDVADDGTISLPRLGRFEADGRDQQDLQSDFMAAFAKAMGRRADVSIAILDRSPVYVVGPVKNQGAYKYIPGMVVLHAIALAGGLDQGLGNTSQLIESVREKERLRKAADDLKRLLAYRARLEAERKDTETLEPPAQLIAIAGKEGAQLFLGAEIAGLLIEKAKRRQQAAELSGAVNAAHNELEALKRKMSQFDVQTDIRKERLGNLKNLMTGGLTTQNGVINIRSELSDIEARRQDCQLAIVQAEGRLAQAEQARDRLQLDNAANLAKAIAATDTAIADAQQSLTASEIVGSIFSESNAGISWATSSTRPRYEIIHRRPGNAPVTLAEETSSLRPGDILKISIQTSDLRDAGRVAHPQIGFKESK